ncbi:MAG TPA: hypothetical protein DDY91_05190 [Planctomycetaceae bacterium]|nr:hypothetical protein [Planctomycetaceae bacterium]
MFPVPFRRKWFPADVLRDSLKSPCPRSQSLARCGEVSKKRRAAAEVITAFGTATSMPVGLPTIDGLVMVERPGV